MNQDQLTHLLHSLDEIDRAVLLGKLTPWPKLLGKPLDPLALLQYVVHYMGRDNLMLVRLIAAAVGRLDTRETLLQGHLEDALAELEKAESEPEKRPFRKGYLLGRRTLVRSIAEAMGFEDVQARACKPNAETADSTES